MRIRGDDSRIAMLREWVVRLLLVTFVVRALIPAGFMPDFAAVSRGTFKIVICKTAAASQVVVNLGDAEQFVRDGGAGDSDSESPLSKHTSDNCAFTGIASLTLPDLEIAPAARLDYAVIVLTLTDFSILPPARAGPALGARAPPTIS